MSQPKQRIQVPEALRDILLEFSISYLLEQPGDVVDYGVEFFTRAQENRKNQMVTAEIPSPDESVISHEEGKLLIIIFILYNQPANNRFNCLFISYIFAGYGVIL